MKNFWTMIILAGLMALVSVMPAAAQDVVTGVKGFDVSFTAPMAFYAADTKLPAGSYHITQGARPGVLLVKSDKGKYEAQVPFEAGASRKRVRNIEVSFNKYGNDEFLNSISAEDVVHTSWILKIKPSARELAAAKTAAAVPHKVSGVYIRK
ncbi:MAG: hypothetical protein ABSF14_03105 [Terriglobia bacterium]|jgi:hypothetical protein